jgi:hypothetical protein
MEFLRGERPQVNGAMEPNGFGHQLGGEPSELAVPRRNIALKNNFLLHDADRLSGEKNRSAYNITQPRREVN